MRAGAGGRPRIRAACGRLSAACVLSPGSRGVASSPATATGRGGADAGTVTRARRGVCTHENPFRWSRDGLINTLKCTGPSAAGKTFVRSLIGLAERCCIAASAPVRTDAPTACFAARLGCAHDRTEVIGSGLNSFPTRGREGVRFRAVSARFAPFRAVLVRFGPESRGRKRQIGSESTPCDLEFDPCGLKYLLGEASIVRCATPPAHRGCSEGSSWPGSHPPRSRPGRFAITPVPGRWCRRVRTRAAGDIAGRSLGERVARCVYVPQPKSARRMPRSLMSVSPSPSRSPPSSSSHAARRMPRSLMSVSSSPSRSPGQAGASSQPQRAM
jgi:hypothetical protein